MSGFLGLGGNSKIDKGLGMANNLFNYGLDTSKELKAAGTDTTQSGLDTMTQIKDYFSKIMGSRPEQMAALAPEMNTINEQADALNTQRANFGTARGGGIASDVVSAETNKLKAIDDALFGIRPQAAQAQAQIGQAEASIGMDQLAQALQALGMSEEAASMYAQTALGRKQQQTEGWKNLMGFISGAAGALK